MLTSILIIAVSLVLLAYWFRYTCILLIRNADGSLDQALPGTPSLSHPLVPREVAGQPSLDPLAEALNRDYRVITYLLQHAAAINLNPIERHLLAADFRVMRFWYRLTRTGSPKHARLALEEMSSVLRLLAHRVEDAAARTRA